MELARTSSDLTGAGRGIGRATALELARMGADIVVAELDRANAERAASEVRGLGRRALVVPTDVTSRQDLGTMVEQTRAEFGRIDTLVNNAGIYRAADDARRHRGTLGRDHEHQRQGRLLRHPGRAADDDRPETRRDRQPGIDGRQDRQAGLTCRTTPARRRSSA